MLVLDSEHARWFRVETDSFEEIDELLDKHERYSDKDGNWQKSSHGQVTKSGMPDMHNRREAEHIHQHLHHIVAKTKELWHSGGYKHLFCVEPDHYKNMLRIEIEKALPPLDMRIISGNFGHATVKELHELFLAHRGGPEI